MCDPDPHAAPAQVELRLYIRKQISLRFVEAHSGELVLQDLLYHSLDYFLLDVEGREPRQQQLAGFP